MSTVYIIDGYGLLFRSFYGIKDLKTSSGIPTNAVYGFLKTLLKIINKKKPEYLLIALDTGGKTFRDDIYEDFLYQKTIKELINLVNRKNTTINLKLEDILENQIKIEELLRKLEIKKEELFNFQNKFNIKDELTALLSLYLNITIDTTSKISTYKGNRSKTPDDLIPQFKIMHEMLDSIGIIKKSKENFEADDVIASLAKYCNQIEQNVCIVSSDKDLMQIISAQNIIYDPYKDITKTYDSFVKEYGFQPNRFLDYLSLIGDTSDNIPGVNGIGPKTAKELVTTIGSVDDILKYQNMFNKNIQKIQEQEDILRLSRKLIKLEENLDLNFNSIEDFRLNIDMQNFKKFAEKYEFKI